MILFVIILPFPPRAEKDMGHTGFPGTALYPKSEKTAEEARKSPQMGRTSKIGKRTAFFPGHYEVKESMASVRAELDLRRDPAWISGMLKN